MAKAKGTLPQANTTRTKLSALDAIDATLQPIGPQPALRAEVDRLVELKDVDSLVALFEAYEAAQMAFLSLENQAGRSNGTREFLEDERAHAWSKVGLHYGFLEQII
jgi:hypothetical protein